MGVFRTAENRHAELEELLQPPVKSATEKRNGRTGSFDTPKSDDRDPPEVKVVCVTNGLSYVGLAIVRRLLSLGYAVRVTVEAEGDMEKVRETVGVSDEGDRDRLCAVEASVMDASALSEAFHGCRGVFHTASFADPSGLSGYSKHVAALEVQAATAVVEACACTPSVSACVMTSSLLACVWGRNDENAPDVVDEDRWSVEGRCRDDKVISTTNQGAHEMYVRGLLATVDVEELAKAQVGVYEAMSRDGQRASGRYLCFDRTVNTRWKAEELETRVGLANRIIINDEDHHIIGADELWRRFELSNGKLRRLLRSPAGCSNGGTLF
ncbi:hypothetical protein QJS04_geneDACA002835 [Acorus gramineus]|uniref:3-beta hydroxysteroid dehydrogenase/isomerase domain-containing protein n=1 Tax=Acorus gramineus TaxID=55184 RepID=A0AAV9BRY0_ACOGR|nr:hypothetical protein QJS04_geneDACA002835 [Acorus gramineus]